MKVGWTKALFVVAGVYDGVLGLAFLLAGDAIFGAFGVTPPNHPGYMQFPSLLLLVFAAMFFRIATDPVKHRGLIWYGMGLKIAYCGTVFGSQCRGGIPAMWIPWAWADLVFLLLFALALRQTRQPASR